MDPNFTIINLLMLWKGYVRVPNHKLKYIIHENIMTREGSQNTFASIS
jgi:hypothetical protein